MKWLGTSFSKIIFVSAILGTPLAQATTCLPTYDGKPFQKVIMAYDFERECGQKAAYCMKDAQCFYWNNASEKSSYVVRSSTRRMLPDPIPSPDWFEINDPNHPFYRVAYGCIGNQNPNNCRFVEA